MFQRYPLVGMPIFIRVTNILWATLEISSKLDPTLGRANTRIKAQVALVVDLYVKRFLAKRLEGITWYNCNGVTVFHRNQCLVYDRPWQKTSWRDGISFNIIGCEKEEREFSDLKNFKSAEEYKITLREKYERYFRKTFPFVYKVPPRVLAVLS